MADKVIAANPDLVQFWSRRSGSLPEPVSGPPESHPDPYWRAGIHPDMVEHLWDTLGPTLPVDCRWIFGGKPVLARPDTGVVFAFPVGTLPFALRLPPAARDEALKAGALREWRFAGGTIVNVADIGDDWVIAVIGRERDREEAMLREAYDYAGKDRG